MNLATLTRRRKPRRIVDGISYTPAADLDSELQEKFDDFNDKVSQWADSVDKLQDRREQALTNALATPLGELLTLAKELADQRKAFQNDKTVILWDRHQLLPEARPALVQDVANCSIDVESAIDKQIEDWAEVGIDVYSTNGGAMGYPEQGMQQLRERARLEPGPMAARGKLNRAKIALEALDSECALKPTESNTAIPWRTVNVDLPSCILNLFN